MVNLPPSGLSQPLYPWILWNLWLSRNQILFEDKRFSEIETTNKAIKDCREWQLAQPLKPPTAPIKPPLPPRAQNNHDPTKNQTVCFSDGAWESATGRGGMGWILKNQTGLTLLQGSGHRRYIASALVAEALAMKDSISAAINVGFKDLLCLTDCKSLIDMVIGNSSVTSIQGILHDIGVMSRSLDSISFSFIPRTRNEAADRLAKAALVVSVIAPLV
ncbi:PREDICTED: uncharacterized protein LOC106323345 [Brassica oleracea var. oleracea]|uniref:uncharacterized protein LOC106323345 n=1 Tax=Brassica oleracea var. oleracea TaxID=109376 RepID=UPI0006A6E096|nr:PREDICTED: uncharacterized protein LOC106323345 [Brassica oleracea var. oleracea]